MPPPQLRLVIDTNATDQTLLKGILGNSISGRHSAYMAHGKDRDTGQTGTYVHANVFAKVMLGNTDVSKDHRLWRYLRFWDVRSTNPATFGNLVKATDCAKDWFDDSQGVAGGYSDAPGLPMEPTWIAKTLYEFAVFVDGHRDDVPGAYFFLIFDVSTTTYEVVRSDPLEIGLPQWAEMETSEKPWLIGRGIRTRTTKALRRP